MISTKLSVLLILATLAMSSCNSSSEEGEFAIYLPAQRISAGEISETDLSDLELKDEPIITVDDIVSYAKETHGIELTASAYERIAQLEVPVIGGIPFVVCVGRDPIYGGAFWVGYSSMSFDGVVIDTLPASLQNPIQIQLGYPSGSFFSGEDPRSNPRILRSLEQAGKLTPTTSTSVTEPVVTATPRETPARKSAHILFFARGDDLWRADLDGDDAQRLDVERLTEEGTLNWQMERGNDFGDVWVNATMYRPPQISPDGQWISLSQTGLNLVLVEVATHKQKKLPRPGAPIVAWSPNSRFFAYVPESTTDHNDLYIYDVEAGRAERLLRLKSGEWGGIRNVVWSPDNRLIAFACCFESQATTGDATGQIRCIEVASGQMDTVGEIKTTVASGSQLCWTADGHVTTDPDQGVRCSHRRRLPIAVSPDGTLSASLSPLSPDDTWSLC